jgi:arylsulfatase
MAGTPRAGRTDVWKGAARWARRTQRFIADNRGPPSRTHHCAGTNISTTKAASPRRSSRIGPHASRIAGQLRRQPGHLVDLMATCVDCQRREYPTEFKGKPIHAHGGPQSRARLRQHTNQFNGDDALIPGNHEGNAAVRARRLGSSSGSATKGRWELYKPQERSHRTRHDLAGTQPDKAKALSLPKWDAWATRANVKPWPAEPAPDTRPTTEEGRKRRRQPRNESVSNATHFELGPDADLRDARAPDIANPRLWRRD